MKQLHKCYRMIVERCICSICPKYKVDCDAEKMCPRAENMINELMEEHENDNNSGSL